MDSFVTISDLEEESEDLLLLEHPDESFNGGASDTSSPPLPRLL